MGMAASQARLLCITARIHDVEHQAQSIQNAKVQLATQSDQIYEDYLKALDETSLTINAMDDAGNKSNIIATFNNLFSRNRVRPADGSNYALRNSQGRLIVENAIEEGYYNFKDEVGGDAMAFALYMMSDGEIYDLEDIHTAELAVYNNHASDTPQTEIHELYNRLIKFKEDHGIDHDDDNGGIYDLTSLDNLPDKNIVLEYEALLQQYQIELYKTYGEEIYNELDMTEEYDYSLFNYYVSIYNQIEACGGCISIDHYNGSESGDAANNAEWLLNMVQSGQFSIEIVENKDSGVGVTLNRTSPSSDTCLAYSPTSNIDNRALAKAEAEYEHKLKQINKKDEQFDLDLSKLETERTALTTEYESVKKVIQENVERTFGIFS